MDFTNPCTFLIQLKSKKDDRIFYCPRSAVKSFTMSDLKFEDILELDVPVEDLVNFLKVFTGDIFAEVKKLRGVEEEQRLIKTAQACGISIGSYKFDSFEVLSDAIFDGDDIDWKYWKAVAQYYNLDMYRPEDAVELLGKRGRVCWLELELKRLHGDVNDTELVQQILGNKFKKY